jgi:putative transposase
VSNLVRDIKNKSNNLINDQKFVHGKFFWHEGFGSFSYSHSHIEQVYQYILNQKEHRRERIFKEEYFDFPKKLEFEYDEKYLFDWYNE